MKKFAQYIWAPFLVAIVIFILCCLLPGSDIPKIRFDFFIPLDKIVHYLMFFGLAGSACFNYIYVTKGNIIILRMLLFCILLPIIFGGLIELYQAYLSIGRSGDWFDFLADTLGVLTVIPFAFYYRRYMLNKYLLNE